MSAQIKYIAALFILTFSVFMALPVTAAQAQIDCEIVKWPRTDADMHSRPRFNPRQSCRNNLPPGAGWQDSQTPQPSEGFECERRGCFQHFNIPPVNQKAGDPPPDYGLTCVYFPCKELETVICDNRGCNKTTGRVANGAAQTSMGPVNPCQGCAISQCEEAARILRENHENFERAIMSTISEEMRKHRLWLREVFLKSEVYKALMMFTNQMSALAMEQVMIVGQFIDAKQVMETWRLFQFLQHQAHRDYTPSEDFCWFGTGVRSLGATEDGVQKNAASLGVLQLNRDLGKFGTPGASQRARDKLLRWQQFSKDYCDPKDNGWLRETTGLSTACNKEEVTNKMFVNADIDYTRLVEKPHTLHTDFTDGIGSCADDPTTPEEIGACQEQSIFALSQNLYGHNVLTRNADAHMLQNEQSQYLYLSLRSIAAKRAVAQNSFDSIVALKSKGSKDMTEEPDTSAFLYSFLKELGMNAEDIEKTIGTNPSYYAQLEILAKNIYQNPDFYANLYDTPVNVRRKGVALRAIERMLDQAIMESQLRQEMAMAVLMSSKLRKADRSAARNISGAE